MIDIHTHILPGLDDGAQSMEDALAMARLAADADDQILFATPHIKTTRELQNSIEIAERVTTLQQAITAAAIPITILPGAEVYPTPEVLPAIEEGLPLTLGQHGRYLLLDGPQSELPHGFEQLLFHLQLHKITPILAHPERIRGIQRDPRQLEGLVQRGLLLQVTAGSVLGVYGKAAHDTAWTLLRHDWVHFLASDAHSPQERRPGLATGARKLAADLPSATVEALTHTNGLHVIHGDPVPSFPRPFDPRKRERWYASLLRSFRTR